MKTLNYSSGVLLVLSITLTQMFSQNYEVPPEVRGNGIVISDAAMEECVKLYNETKWLNEEIDRTVVDQYNSYSVNAYNAKVNKANMMSQMFNRDCAGRQSQSAYEAAQKLNRR